MSNAVPVTNTPLAVPVHVIGVPAATGNVCDAVSPTLPIALLETTTLVTLLRASQPAGDRPDALLSALQRFSNGSCATQAN